MNTSKKEKLSKTDYFLNLDAALKKNLKKRKLFQKKLNNKKKNDTK